MFFQPKTVGRLTIEKKLDSDGVFDTYRGTLRVDADRQVLVRRLQDWVTSDKTQLAAVEARVGDLLALRHPRLVRLLDFVSDGDARYIVEESVAGIEMSALIGKLRAERAALPPNVFLHFALQLCAGVEALHSRRGKVTDDEAMLHRGIRPSGIHISPEGSLLLGGYGLITNVTRIPKGGERGAVADRVAFLAPEQTEDGRPVTVATDVFSLGAVLYYMLTGQALFEAETELQTRIAIKACDVSDRIAATRRLIPGIERVFTRCLNAKPNRRYQHVHVLRGDLRALTEAYDNSRIADDVLDVLARVGLEPVSRGNLVIPGSRFDAEREDVGDEPTARDGALAPLQYRDDVTDDVDPETDPGAEHTVDTGSERNERTIPSVSGDSPEFVGHMLVPGDEEASDPAPSDPNVLPVHTGPGPRRAELPMPVMPMPGPAALRPRRGDDDIPVVEQTARSIDAIREVTDRAVARAPVAQVENTPAVVRPTTTDDDDRPVVPVAFAVIGAVAALVLAFFGGMQISASLPGGEVDGATQAPDSVIATSPGALTTVTSPVTTSVIATTPGPTPSTEIVAHPPAAALPAEVAPAAADATLTPPAQPPTAAADRVARVAPPAATPKPAAEPVNPSVAPRTPAPSATPAVAPPAVARTGTLTTNPAAPAVASARPTPTPVVAASTGARPGTGDAVVQTTPPTTWSPPVRLDDAGYAARAAAGKLTEADRTLLDGLDLYHPDFTRARVWLYEDATKRGVLAERKRHLQALMRLPENTYNPVFLIEDAQVAIESKDYDTALSRARKAEQHWARLPSSAIFHKKATIYEQQGLAWYGLFITSEGGDIDAINQSIRSWERYRQHVASRDAGLAARADEQIAKLSDIRRRLE